MKGYEKSRDLITLRFCMGSQSCSFLSRRQSEGELRYSALHRIDEELQRCRGQIVTVDRPRGSEESQKSHYCIISNHIDLIIEDVGHWNDETPSPVPKGKNELGE